ncbi:hypothetical protein [Clostridium estertheticum]
MPSTSLVTSIEHTVFPVELSSVAGASIITLTTAIIGKTSVVNHIHLKPQ